MNKIMLAALVAAFGIGITGCQTRITAEKYPEQVVSIQEVVKVNGEDVVITKDCVIASGGWYATARSPLYATEALEGLDLGVGTNGYVHLSLSKYGRDVSSNAVEMVDGMFKNGANLVTAIGDAYVKIAGGGAQADTVMNVVKKSIAAFKAIGGNVEKANVTTDTTKGTFTISDGEKCVECDQSGNCTECTTGACTDGSCAKSN